MGTGQTKTLADFRAVYSVTDFHADSDGLGVEWALAERRPVDRTKLGAYYQGQGNREQSRREVEAAYERMSLRPQHCQRGMRYRGRVYTPQGEREKWECRHCYYFLSRNAF